MTCRSVNGAAERGFISRTGAWFSGRSSDRYRGGGSQPGGASSGDRGRGGGGRGGGPRRERDDDDRDVVKATRVERELRQVAGGVKRPGQRGRHGHGGQLRGLGAVVP